MLHVFWLIIAGSCRDKCKEDGACKIYFVEDYIKFTLYHCYLSSSSRFQNQPKSESGKKAFYGIKTCTSQI